MVGGGANRGRGPGWDPWGTGYESCPFRNEYLRALVGQFGDATADRVMPEYDAFATAMANVELPLWFYSAEAIARLVPLVKSVAADHVDARPIAIGHTEARSIGSQLVEGVTEVAGDVLSPQQLAVGVHGGTSILVHGIRVMLDQHGSFVLVRIDLRNAYNAISRAAVIRRMAARPEFAHLVPFLHAMTGPGSMLLLGRMLQRLFPFGARPDSSEGLPQGFNLASLGFCVGIQPELEALDALLSAFGGCARAIMDDVYAVGPASVVFPAVQRFVQTLRLLTGLDSHVGKYACYSPEYDLAAATYRHSTAGVASADAYVSCFIESAEVFLDRRDASGALVPGLFPSLHTTFGAGAFDHGGPRFHDE